MGMRVHVAKKYVVEWVELPYLNYKPQEFKDLLTNMDCDVYNVGGDEFSKDFEVEKEQFNNALAKLKNFDSLGKEEQEDINSMLKECEFDLHDAIECMELCQKNAERKDGILHFSFF